MKLKITFKNPDAVNEALENAGISLGNEGLNEAISKFIKYGEYVTIELDSEAQTARVIEVKNA